MGAELTSLKSKTTGIEYIWCGNTDIWYGQSPILFPIIGRLLDDKYSWDGTEY
jgi:galactose mutarotase-like enzyme